MTPSTNELEKLRDILYGDQLREVINRITALEHNLQTLSEQINGKLVTLDSENKKNAIKQSNELADKLNDQRQGLVGQLDEIRKQVEKEAKQSKDRNDALKKDLLALVAKLESSKVERLELSKALIELGQSIHHGK